VHDPLSVVDLVDDELRQRRESGYDVSALEARVSNTSGRNPDRLEEINLDVISTRRRSDCSDDNTRISELAQRTVGLADDGRMRLAA
jgi:hypothetical protein